MENLKRTQIFYKKLSALPPSHILETTLVKTHIKKGAPPPKKKQQKRFLKLSCPLFQRSPENETADPPESVDADPVSLALGQ